MTTILIKKYSFGLICLLAVCGRLKAADIEHTRLSILEEAGVSRNNEPITVGVPFIEGTVPDIARLELRDEVGQRIPAQFTEVSRWRTAKGGVRWAHLDFMMSVPSAATRTVVVVSSDTALAPVITPLKVTLTDNLATVMTGPLKFTVRGSGFNGFDAVWLDPTGKNEFSETNLLIKAGVSAGGKIESADKVFTSTGDATGKVEIESAGPGKIVLVTRGSHKNGTETRLDYVVRFYAYANSPVVRVSYTFINRHGKTPGDMVEIDGFNFALTTTMLKPSVIFGTDAAPWEGYAKDQPLTLFQKDSDAFAIMAGAGEVARGRGKSVKSLSLGWFDMGASGKHVACGLRWFWQMHPKELKVSPDGTAALGMYPRTCGKKLDVYMGQSRTHDMTFLFHNGISKQDLNNFFIASQRPLRPWAPLKYYNRDTSSPGFTAESDQSLFAPDKWKIVQDFDQKMSSALSGIRKKLDGHTYEGYTAESYGFYAWGDTFHWGWSAPGKSPKDTKEWHLSWEGNYYDYPNLCLMQMFRTGDRNYYWHAFEPNTVHIRDVFTCQYHPLKELCGACRYCPPRNHVATDEGTPYVSNEFNHNKSQSMFAHWYLTGDWRTREVLDLMMNNGLNNHAADSGFANRGIGSHLALVWQSWELTGEQKYKDRILQLVRCAGRELEQTGGEFMKGPDPGIGQEGLVYAHLATGDAYAEKLLRLVSERWVKKNRANPSSALCLAYCGVLFGNEQMTAQAWKCIAHASSSNRPKDTSEPNRNMPYALYYLSNACNLKLTNANVSATTKTE